VNAFAAAAIRAIEWYQRELSPRKGFSCAYRLAYGGHSCSGVVKRAFAEAGVAAGMSALFHQPSKCHAAARKLDRPDALFCCFLPF
jgi:putative component of membrane protein insertase Oxa1/YidC/SpoIIIJ protein YidD